MLLRPEDRARFRSQDAVARWRGLRLAVAAWMSMTFRRALTLPVQRDARSSSPVKGVVPCSRDSQVRV